LLRARLFPDMFPRARQVQVACDYSRGLSAELAGLDVPKNDDTESSFAELRDLISKTLSFIDGIDPSKIGGQEGRESITRAGTPKERKFDTHSYLLSYGLPQFFCHMTTAYAILRHNGIEVGKRDYMGQY